MGKRNNTGAPEAAIRVVSGTFVATGQSGAAAAVGMSHPDQYVPAQKDDNVQSFWGYFNVAIFGVFVGTVTVEKSFDGGATWLGVSASPGGALLSHTAPASYVLFEPERDVLYRLNCTAYTSGTVNYRISH